MENYSIQRSDKYCQNSGRLDEDLEQDVNVNIARQQKDENLSVLAHDNTELQISPSEANLTHTERNESVENKVLKSCGRTVQQGAEFPDLPNFNVQNSVLTTEDETVLQDGEKSAGDNELQANMVLQQSEAPTKQNLCPEKKMSRQTSELSENMKATGKRERQGAITPVEVHKTQAEARVKLDKTAFQELMQRQQEMQNTLSKIISLFNFNQVIVQQAQASQQEITLSSNNPKGIECKKLGEIVTPDESEDNHNDSVQKLGENVIVCHSESKDGMTEGSWGFKETKAVTRSETKEGVALEYRGTILARVCNDEPENLQPSKGYVTLQRPKVDDVTTRAPKSKDYISGLPIRVDNATKGTQKTKDYVSLIPLELDEIVHSSETKDNGTILTLESDNATQGPKATKDYVTVLPREQMTEQPFKIKDYVTVKRPKLEIEIMQVPFSKDYTIFKPQKSHDATMDTQKVKDYVKVNPRDADDAIKYFQRPKDHKVFIPQSEEDYTFVPSSQQKGYVAMIPTNKENTTSTTESEPPTHIFWPVRRLQDFDVPNTPIQAPVSPQSSQETGSVPESEEPQHVTGRTRKIKKVSPRLEQVLSPRGQKRLQIPEDDDLPLVSFVESHESVEQSNRTEVPRNRTPGMCEFLQRICNILRERLEPLQRILTFNCGLFYGLLAAIALYFMIINILYR